MIAGLECGACGHHNRDGARFCTDCGGRLMAPSPPAEGIDGLAPLVAARTVLASPPGGRAAAPPAGRSPASSAPPRHPVHDSAYPPLLGPVDRVTFQTEQARRRRQTWRLTAVCGLAAILTGLPASLVFTPVVLALMLLVTKLAQLTVGLPAGVWGLYERALFPLIRVIDEYTDESPASPSFTLVVQAVLVWVGPGLAAMLVIWPALRALFMRSGAGGALLALGARPPRRDDLEERQLVNVVAEMAIAAGLPAPAVMLLDTDTANAAAIGSRPDDATLLVSRRLLDDLDRDETQGVLGALVASIGNGDLRIALTIIAVYQTYAFIYALLKAPFSPLARAALGRMVRWTFAFRRSRDQPAEAQTVARLLSRGLWDSDETDDFARAIDAPKGAPTPGAIRLWGLAPVLLIGLVVVVLVTKTPVPFEAIVGIPIAFLLLLVLLDLRYVLYAGGRAAVIGLLIISLPYYIGTFMSQFLLYFLSWLVLGPLLALVWRTRRYLADATAVQLTRNPSAVAGGLLALQRSGGLLPGGRWAAPLFVVGQEVGNVRRASQMAGRAEDQQAAKAALGGLWSGNPAAAQQFAQRMAEREAVEGDAGFAGEPASMIPLNPSLARRIARLRAMGAEVREDGAAASWKAAWRQVRARGALPGIPALIALAVLIPLVCVLLLVAMALMAMFTLACGALMMAVVYGLLQLLRP
jgi:Zn-dependent protease with chaperone function